MPPPAHQRLHQVPDIATVPLLAVVEDFMGVPGPPGNVQFYGPSTEQYSAFVEGESVPSELEVLGVTDTHTFRLTVGANPAELAARAASILQDDVMDELGAPWPELTDPLTSSTLLEPVARDDSEGTWEGNGLRCRIGELQQTFGHLIRPA